MDRVAGTPRLTLRRFTAADVALLVELDSDPEVMRFLTGGKPTPPAVVEHDLLPSIVSAYDRWPRFGRWAAYDRADGSFVGWFGLEVPEHGTGAEVELGYRLRRAAWGRGLATEGARALVVAAFTKLGAQHVYAETMAVNTRSRRVLEKAGLRLRRSFHLRWDEPITGVERGEVEYSLLEADWRRRHEATAQ